ncbi:MAG: hypothetical protein Q8P50_17555 [Bacillota bacterium]|nr:hypothetical protein [Bacillota bacterium]
MEGGLAPGVEVELYREGDAVFIEKYRPGLLFLRGGREVGGVQEEVGVPDLRGVACIHRLSSPCAPLG